MKKIIAVIICFTLMLTLIGCRKTTNTLSSTGSNLLPTSSSSSSQINILDEDSTSNDNSSYNSSSVSSNNSSTESQPQSFEEKYGFNRLVDVKYECIKEIPGGDAEYEITTVTTDKGYALIYVIFLSCSDKSITIKDRTVTIPFEYRQKHDSITLTATHNLAKVSCEFTITFDKWELIFEDNFDGTELNTDVWNVWNEKRDNGYAYSKQNSFLDGKGNLINRMSLLQEPDPTTGQTRLTSVIETNDKFETTYGYFEIRMIPHRAEGLMGAFWLSCGDMSNDDAPKDNTAVNGCEIDIVETFYHTKTPTQTIHWDGYGWYQDTNGEWQTVTKTKGLYVPPMEEIFDGNYHIFSLCWTPEEYIFLIDGEVTNRTSDMGICNQPGYILISSHFNDKAGEFPLKPGEHTDMIVDYVRVYQNENYK